MKTTEKQKQQITKLMEKGLSQRKIADKLKLSQATVGYWSSEELRKKKIKNNMAWFKKKSKKEKSKIYKQRLEYQRKYQHKRYTFDPIFRAKQIARVKKK